MIPRLGGSLALPELRSLGSAGASPSRDTIPRLGRSLALPRYDPSARREPRPPGIRSLGSAGASPSQGRHTQTARPSTCRFSVSFRGEINPPKRHKNARGFPPSARQEPRPPFYVESFQRRLTATVKIPCDRACLHSIRSILPRFLLFSAGSLDPACSQLRPQTTEKHFCECQFFR